MPEHFSSSFWSPDYISGISVIFAKLNQGCIENSEILSMVSSRIALETSYANGLEAFPTKHAPTSQGFDKDEGATLRQTYMSFLDDIQSQGQVHAKISAALEQRVRQPFYNWSQDHKARIISTQSSLVNKIKSYNKKLVQVQKCQQSYFAKCRQLENAEGLALLDSPSINRNHTPSIIINQHTRENSSSTSSERSTIPFPTALSHVELAGESYSPDQLSKLLKDILDEIPLDSFKVTLLGRYENCCTGEDIVLWARKRLDYKNVGKAEKFGQGLIDNGFLKSVGRVGSKFVNAASCHYQWQDKAFTYDPTASVEEEILAGPITMQPISEYLSGLLPSGTREVSRTYQEISDTDERYRSEILELDLERCELESSIFDVLKMLEIMELDRLRAIKTVLYDFSKAISGSLGELGLAFKQLSVQHVVVQPESDLSYMIDSYKTSYFAPKVVIYESFHNASKCQTFGVDLASVLFMVPKFLTYIQNQNEPPATVDMWLQQSSLSSIHRLRNQINNGKEFDPMTILPLFSLPHVISTFKQFLLELQDSIISFTMYDVFKGIYSNNNSKQEEKLEKIVTALSHSAKPIIESLDFIITYFADLCDGNDELIAQLSIKMGPYMLRSRIITGANMTDKHPASLVKDLIQRKTEIFEAITKRLAEASQARARAVSSSEVNRRAIVEARNKELAAQAMAARATRSRNGSRAGSPPSPHQLLNTPPPSSTTSVISSNGLLPLALSPSRYGNLSEINGDGPKKRVVSGVNPLLHHRKTSSNPVKSTVGSSTSTPINTDKILNPPTPPPKDELKQINEDFNLIEETAPPEGELKQTGEYPKPATESAIEKTGNGTSGLQENAMEYERIEEEDLISSYEDAVEDETELK